jgi:biotin synthase
MTTDTHCSATDSRLTEDAESILPALRWGEFSEDALRSALQWRGSAQDSLFQLAREARSAAFSSNRVEVRSVIELSNVCRQGCLFCNMGRMRKRKAYVLSASLVRELVEHLYRNGRRVIMFQSGENPAPSYVAYVSSCVAQIKSRFPDLTLILCLGNLGREQYAQLKDAGAGRYILKFETSNPELYSRLKPYDTLSKRLACLEDLLALGFGVGSGNIVGLPGQDLDDIVDDLLLLYRQPLLMASSTVFVPAEDSELGDAPAGDLDLTLNTMALCRIMNPHRFIPTTSSLDRIREGGQYLGLQAGANTVTVHDGTPAHLQPLFPIYSTHRQTPTAGHLGEMVARAGMIMP